MKYELNRLELQIDDFIQFASRPEHSQTPLSAPIHKKGIDHEVKRVKKSLIKSVLDTGNEGKIERYIREHQTMLAGLSNRLGKATQNGKAGGSGPDAPAQPNWGLGPHFTDRIEGLLLFIEEHFPKYFCQDCQVTDHKKLLKRMGFEKKFRPFLHMGLCELHRIALKPFFDFIERAPDMTYRRLSYLQILEKAVLPLLPDPEDKNNMKQLEKELVCLNFNNKEFFQYLAEKYTCDYHKETGTGAQIEKLLLYRKELKQVPIRPGLYFIKGYAPIRDQLATWIEQEVDYLESLDRKKQGNSKAVTGPHKKIKTFLSVPELGGMAYLFNSVEIHEKLQPRDMAEFITGNFSTKGTRDISPKSFGNLFNLNDPGVREQLRTTLIRMLNYLNGLNP